MFLIKFIEIKINALFIGLNLESDLITCLQYINLIEYIYIVFNLNISFYFIYFHIKIN